jgi:hypothetical protein
MGKTAKNDITRDKIKTKAPNDTYRAGWERIFNKKQNEKDNDGNNRGPEDNIKRPTAP